MKQRIAKMELDLKKNQYKLRSESSIQNAKSDDELKDKN